MSLTYVSRYRNVSLLRILMPEAFTEISSAFTTVGKNGNCIVQAYNHLFATF